MKELPKHDAAFLDHAATEGYIKFISSSRGAPQDPLGILTDWALLVSGLDLAEEDQSTEIPDS